MSTPIVRGHHPEPIATVRSATHGDVLQIRVSHTASMIASGDAELVGELNPATRAAFDAAVTHQMTVDAIRRSRRGL